MITNVSNSIVLTKYSTENEIKTYFQKVLVLKQSNEEFPINLDEVWMLVYADKGKATRALKKDFIENEDFILLTQNGKQTQGGSNEITYKLSISCLEYFIARKVRPVFEVYRQVFHKAIEQNKPLTQLEVLQQSITMLIEQDKRISTVENDVLLLKAQTQMQTDYFTVAGYGTLQGVKVPLNFACKVGQYAARKCKQEGILMGECFDQRFGKVRTYPSSILNEAFKVALN